MSDYFSKVRDELADAAARQSHLRWYQRVRLAHRQAFMVVFAALVVATPALAAVSGWLRFGKPNPTPAISPTNIFGVVKPGGSQMLPIRVADPQGGPQWGLQLVRTDRGNTCLQLGRVEDGKLGSLGIDGAWDNDDEFHVIRPNATYADSCGSTDATGHGYFANDVLGINANANPTADVASGPESEGCKLPGVGGPKSWRDCPAGSNRIIFYGLLGPDATGITYREPDGKLATERTVDGVGAYLIVFTYDQASCRAYSLVPAYTAGCDGIRSDGVSPDQQGAVTKITYRDGRSCSVTPSPELLAAYRTFLQSALTRRDRRTPFSRRWRDFLRKQDMTADQLMQAIHRTCPAVGWVPFKPTVTSADVRAPIRLRIFPAGKYACPDNSLHLPDGCNYPEVRNHHKLPARTVIPVEWSFTAREPVTRSHSWYSWMLESPTSCGGEGFTTDTRIRAGETLRYSTFLDPGCKGTYRLVVGYMPAAPAGVSRAGGGGAINTGMDGSLVVGRISFKIPAS